MTTALQVGDRVRVVECGCPKYNHNGLLGTVVEDALPGFDFLVGMDGSQARCLAIEVVRIPEPDPDPAPLAQILTKLHSLADVVRDLIQLVEAQQGEIESTKERKDA